MKRRIYVVIDEAVGMHWISFHGVSEGADYNLPPTCGAAKIAPAGSDGVAVTAADFPILYARIEPG